MEIVEVINELNSKISNTFDDYKGCYLYGSRARGDYNHNSDIDIIVLFDEVNRNKDLELCGLINNLDYKYNVFIDFQTYTLDKLSRNPLFYNEVVNKGIYYGPA